MKNILAFTLVLLSTLAFSQADRAKTLEQRAHDFHTALTKNDNALWRTYMTENFTPALIDRPMRAQVVTSENDPRTSSSTTNTETQIEAKLAMFERLHRDFGKGKISSIRVEGDAVTMTVITDGGMTGVFRLESETKSPWMIDKLSIAVEATN